MPDWLKNFESIGENCEFGFVQRGLGEDGSSFLRWALLDSVAATSVGIRSGFEGVFAFENLLPAGAGTMVRDIAAGVAFHTDMRSVLREGVWEFVHSINERRQIHARELRKHDYLRSRFLQGLIAGERIYVAKRNDGLTDADAASLFEAIASWGTGRLLFLTQADDDHPSGSVERINSRVIHGWIDRFAPFSAANEVSSSAWESVLRETVRSFEREPKLARRSRPFDFHAHATPVSSRGSDEEFSRTGIDIASVAREPASLVAPGGVARPTILATAPLARPTSQALPRSTQETDSVPRWMRTGKHQSESIAQIRARATQPSDTGHLVHDLERMVKKLIVGQGGLANLMPEQFLQDDYFVETYPALLADRPLTVEVAKTRHVKTGYVSAPALAVVGRTASVDTHQGGVASYRPEDLEQLKRIFAPRLYQRLAGLMVDDSDMLWNHYIRHGLPADIAPTPLFDPDLYRQQVSLAGLPPRESGEPMVMHWLRVGCPSGIVPSTVFDAAFYRARNTDVSGSDLDAYRHYLSNGLNEGRAPNIWFDQHWYSGRNPASGIERFDHFIAVGLEEHRTPSALVDEIMRHFGQNEPFDATVYAALLNASLPWRGMVTAESISLLVHLYSPYWQNPTETPLGGFLTYLQHGISEDRKPGPLFDGAVYRRRAIEAGLPPFESDNSALLHWLQFGYAARVVPTERFDEAVYRAENPDIARTELWGFEHFVRHGLFEGRVASRAPMFRHREPLPGTTAAPMPLLCRHWYAMDFPDAETGLGDEIPKATYDRLYALLDSDWLASVFMDAQAIEPEVGELATIDDFALAPYYDGMGLRHSELRRRLSRTAYDTVICVPWIRVGGADLVAGLLAKAVLQIRPGEDVLVLRVDQPHFERANWLPGGVDVVDMSDLVAGIPVTHQENLLRVLLRGVAPRRVINVNSRLCWSVFRTYGANLASTMKLYAYMFCWDLTPAGLRAGYPAEFYAVTADNVTAFLTDTNYLRDELSAMYRLPAPMSNRIVPLFTPAQSRVWTPTAARIVCDRADPASRRLVLWAGRLDRQKRFDLVQDIARQMPDVEFRCWGAALLDSPPDLSALPANVRMQGGFDNFDELPLLQAGAWLFTALWEGMPTTIIELATRGVPIVASAVGGVPELIQPATGWPVPGDASVAVYISILREALSDPEEAARRAENLQRRVAENYNEATYNAALAHLFEHEDEVRS